ncbi:MAG TPA: nucleotide sugar dehydrogenase [Candidatus Thermoplasmatota archaeon]|nr:nucleotide sugar dehydrogenase [Candidatus Thermoplasmatota archaeon]
MNPLAQQALEKIKKRDYTITVVGLGYVGLPTAVAFAKYGFRVIGADLNPQKVESLNQGISPLKDLDLDDDVAEVVRTGKFSATTDIIAGCAEGDAVLLIVPTPVHANKQPDLSYVAKASESAAKALRRGQLLVLESTTYPGTTEEFVIEAAHRLTKMKAGTDFGVAYCPERYNPGDPEHTLSNVFRVVGAIDEDWAEVAAAMYGVLNGGKITRVKDLKTAEAAKVIENIQRDLNIALINELALIFERLGIDTHEVLNAAATKWNFVKYSPGPGVGGHCLPVDPYYLTSLAERVGYHPKVILAGRAVNDHMPHHVVELVVDGLNEARKPVKGSKIAILGLSYKANTGDPRETPAEHVVAELRRKGADLRLCDPWIKDHEVETVFHGPNHKLESALRGADAVVLLTDHQEFRKMSVEQVVSATGKGAVVVDSRNCLVPTQVRAAGLTYRGVGRPA